ncbi:excinuclease ABC subunit UvrC [Gulosibacter molinativorax]|uniref:UvrABC system protein C n=1 Tax=Gulosibacter molinativorax TaxID=256821 RepID=A0ABT7C7F8_9MICO|nr:excinuclease ABC subunit UvrC [Gulosibacter molinativorax]MDJ1371104.1 excinuclease ABC subunit UvrC [Gulosibacter molinativorax]QUY61464.1 UvrABC system protein C [Gulosibacter molinativorax]
MSTYLEWRPKTGDIPTGPGVYRWLGANGRLLYVGKAKNLRARLSNYFAPLETLPERTRRMVTSAVDVTWTVVNTEREALQLEYTWIQEYSPPYNVRLKDDKSYPYMAVTLADEAPRVLMTRNHRIRGALYFGPFPKVYAVTEAMNLMLQVFPIRTCNDTNYRRAMDTGKPCFAGQIGKCGGPCSQKVTIAEHRAVVDDFVHFMETYDRSVAEELTVQMNEAAADFRYEDAAKLRDRVRALETLLEKSVVVLPDSADADVYGIVEDELSAAVQLFAVRGGRVRGVRGWVLDKELDVDRGTLVQQVLQDVYGEQSQRPAREVIVPTLPDDAEALAEVLTEIRGSKVQLRTAQRGAKADLLRTAGINAMEALKQYKLKRTADYVARTDALNDLQEALGMPEAPLRIEAYDVSHLQGTGIVASMVVFEDGLPKKRDYRRFNIADSTDDTDSIYQTLMRRLARLDEDEQAEQPAQDALAHASAEGDEGTTVVQEKRRFAYRPQLLLIDGGQPQVAAAARALRDSGHEGEITIAGIAKRLEELWLPDDPFPVILPRSSEALFLVQRLRDEAHRFAIVAQRKSRKTDIHTQLAEIPGIGPARTKSLIRHFGSVKRLRGASAEELTAVPGIGLETAKLIERTIGNAQRSDGSLE